MFVLPHTAQAVALNAHAYPRPAAAEESLDPVRYTLTMTGETPNNGRDYSFVLSSLDPAGRRTVQRLQAPDPQSAINDLSRRGHTQVKLFADDPSRTTLSSPALRAHVNRVLSAEDQVRFATGGATPFWRIAKVYKLAAIPVLIAIGALLYRHLTPAPWTVADALLIFVLFLPLTLAAPNRGRVAVHQRIQQASLDADYDKVLRLLPALAEAMAPMGKTAVDLHITTERAKALAGLGRTDEALQTMQQLESRPDIPREKCLLRLAVVYACIPDREAALDCYTHAEEMNPTDPMATLGQAEVLSIHLHRPADARVALARARALPLTEELRTLSGYIDGAIALEEGHAAQAVAAFQLVLPALERHARTSPTAQGLLATVNALYAVALAKSGDPAAAARALAAAEPILSRQPRQCGELLERAQRAVDGGALKQAA